MYAYFEVDERTMLRLRHYAEQGRLKLVGDRAAPLPVKMGLADEEGYPHEGNDQLRRQSARSRPPARCRFAECSTIQIACSRPGLFVRVRLPIGAVVSSAARFGASAGNRPGAEVRLRRRRREQGTVPPRGSRQTAERPPGDPQGIGRGRARRGQWTAARAARRRGGAQAGSSRGAIERTSSAVAGATGAAAAVSTEVASDVFRTGGA